MADVTIEQGIPICWADTTDYSNTNSGISRTDQIDLTSLADGSARQGAKKDLGVNRSPSYACLVGLEFDVAPTAGEVVHILWSSSYDSTAGVGNTGGSASTGADAAWSPGGGAEADREEYMHHLTYIGAFVAAADAATTYQYSMVNPEFIPPTRYGFPVIFNQSGQALEGNAVEMFVALIPQTPDVAAS
ncbi:MAG: hypothetical protein GF411_06385 [Candidatus Lokiarchaeota archaeon]|nr:hypothetical protein [Candidatus Lokiarchaeota archaeon]